MNAPVTPGYSVFRPGPERLREALDIDKWAFPSPRTAAEAIADGDERPWDRVYGLQASDGRLVAFHWSHLFERFAVPGAFVPTAGLSGVAVHPQHRRRGLLTAMMGTHLEHCVQRGESLSVLTASEPAIYGRFGYGLASTCVMVSVPHGAALRDVPGRDAVTLRVDHAIAERYLDTAVAVQRDAAWSAGLVRPGWIQWENRAVAEAQFRDPPAHRAGAETLRLMVAERDGRPVGFAFFRRTSRWIDGNPRGTATAGTMAYVDAAAAHAIWSGLANLDLVETTKADFLSPGDALLGLLVDPRAATPIAIDGLWVRIVDLPRALASRQYAAPADLVLEVTDARLPSNAGRWRLRADAFTDGAEVSRTSDAPDVCLDIRELGAVYLGGTALAALAGAGLVSARTPELLARAATAFAWPVTPALNWDF